MWNSILKVRNVVKVLPRTFNFNVITERYPANSELLQCMKRLHNAFGEYDVNLREIKRNRKDKRSTKFNQTDPYVGDVFDDPYFLSKEVNLGLFSIFSFINSGLF